MLKIEQMEERLMPMSALVPDPENAREHDDRNIQSIKDSLTSLAHTDDAVSVHRDIVIQRGTNKIIVGNGMYQALKEMGYTGDIKVKIADDDDKMARRRSINDNRTAELATWNVDMLKLNIEAVGDFDFAGFTEEELRGYFEAAAEAVEDDFDIDAELEKPTFAEEGDLWHVGRHRIICGDSTLPATYARLMGGVKANLLLTDPPYFVQLENSSGKIKNDDLDDKEAYEFLMKAFKCFHDALANDAATYVFYASSKSRIFYDAYEDSGFRVSTGLVWKKDGFTLSRMDWKPIVEPIIYGWKAKGKHKWYGDQKQPCCFEFARIKNSKTEGCGHPSSKPVPMLAYLLQQSTQANNIVLDGFLGSASTLVACDQLARVCYGIEFEPKFVSVGVARYIALHDGRSDNVYVERGGKELSYDEVMATMPKENANLS